MAPLVLSVRSSKPSGRSDIKGSSGAGDGSCRFCAAPAKPQEPFSFLDADGACSYCQLVRRLESPSIDDQAVLIWLPELTQAAVIAIVRTCHSRLVACGLHNFSGWNAAASGGATIPVEAREALAAIAALKSRIAEVEARLGSSSPKALGQALLRLKDDVYADRARRLHGVRLLPLVRPQHQRLQQSRQILED